MLYIYNFYYKERKLKMKSVLTFFLLVFLIPAVSQASYTLYTTESGFTTVSPGLSFESFEDAAVTNSQTMSSFDAGDFIISGPPNSIGVWNIPIVEHGHHATDGTNSVIASVSNIVPIEYTFTFDHDVSDFGLWIVGMVFNDPRGFDWNFTDSNNNTFNFETVYDMGTSPNVGGFDLFLGMQYTGETIDSFTLSEDVVGYDGLTFDSVYYTPASVPVPSSIILLGAGILSLVGIRRIQ